jgi:hypothetical protein
MIIGLLFPIVTICGSTWREEAIIYVLHSFKCYLYENLDLIIIFCTLLQKNYLERYIIGNIITVLFPIAAICRSTWRKEAIIYVLHSFKCYLYENLDLIIIFCTLLQILLFKTIIIANIIIVLLFPIAAICRSTWRKEAIIYDLLSFLVIKYEFWMSNLRIY